MKRTLLLVASLILLSLIPYSISSASTAERVSNALHGQKEDLAAESTEPSEQEGYIYIWTQDNGLQYVRDEKYFELKSSIESRTENICYYDAVFSSLSSPIDMNYDDNDHRCVSIYYTWDSEVSKKFAIHSIEECSDDISAYLSENHDYITDIYVFWNVPYLSDQATKYMYTSCDGKALINGSSGPLGNRNSEMER